MNHYKVAVLLLCLFGLKFGVSAQDEIKFKNEGNPLVRHMFTADPSGRVYDDGRLYVYTSHDEDDAAADEHFYMINWHVFSTDNMNDWVDHGPIFSLDDISWASKQAWAPDCIKRNGKYYFYYPVEQTMIGVAVGDSPTGPFVDALGKPLVNNKDNIKVVGREPIDPGILIDDDGQAYMFFGCRDARVVKLKDNMIELDGDIEPLVINGIEGHKEHNGGYYGEAPWVFKRNDTYYLIYANGWAPHSTMVYAMSKNPTGPFDYIGEVMDPVSSGTSHGSIVEYKDKWYVFYHDKMISENNKRRSICVDEITFDDNGKIIPLTFDKKE